MNKNLEQNTQHIEREGEKGRKREREKERKREREKERKRERERERDRERERARERQRDREREREIEREAARQKEAAKATEVHRNQPRSCKSPIRSHRFLASSCCLHFSRAASWRACSAALSVSNVSLARGAEPGTPRSDLSLGRGSQCAWARGHRRSRVAQSLLACGSHLHGSQHARDALKLVGRNEANLLDQKGGNHCRA